MAEGVEDSEGLPLGVSPEGTGVFDGVRVPVGEAGLEGDSEGYADSVDVAEGLTPIVTLAVGVREGVRVPVSEAVMEGVCDSVGVVVGVTEELAPAVSEGVSEAVAVVLGVSVPEPVGEPV